MKEMKLEEGDQHDSDTSICTSKSLVQRVTHEYLTMPIHSYSIEQRSVLI